MTPRYTFEVWRARRSLLSRSQTAKSHLRGLLWASPSRCCLLVGRNTHNLLLGGRRLGISLSAVFRPAAIEVGEATPSSKGALMLIVETQAPTEAIEITISAIVTLDKAPFRAPERQGVNNLQALKSAQRTSCWMAVVASLFLTAL